MSKRWHPEHLAQVEAYVLAIAPRLGLAHWAIVISNRLPKDEEAEAEVHTAEGQTAAIRICQDFFRFTPEHQRATLTHELCHLPGVWASDVGTTLQSVLSNRLGNFVEKALELAQEHEAEHWARVLAPTLPLPDFYRNAEPYEVIK